MTRLDLITQTPRRRATKKKRLAVHYEHRPVEGADEQDNRLEIVFIAAVCSTELCWTTPGDFQ